MGEKAGNWEVFDAVNYNGHTVVLISGEELAPPQTSFGVRLSRIHFSPSKEYANPGKMGIVHPVKSIIKLVDN